MIRISCVRNHFLRASVIPSVSFMCLLAFASASLATPITSGLQLWLDGSDPDGDGVGEGGGEDWIAAGAKND